jgi:hypothetical protein
MTNDAIRGEKRTYYSTRIILLAVAAAVCVSSLVGGMVGWVVADNTNATIVNKSCEIRREVQDRTDTIRELRNGVVGLATRIGQTRLAERDAFRGLGVTFNIEAEVRELVQAVDRAAADDRQLAKDIGAIRVNDLSLTGC